MSRIIRSHYLDPKYLNHSINTTIGYEILDYDSKENKLILLEDYSQRAIPDILDIIVVAEETDFDSMGKREYIGYYWVAGTCRVVFRNL